MKRGGREMVLCCNLHAVCIAMLYQCMSLSLSKTSVVIARTQLTPHTLMGTTKELSRPRLKQTHAHCYIYTTNKDTVDPPEAPDDIDSNPESEEDQQGQCVVRPKQATAQKSEERSRLWLKELTEEV